MKEIKLCSKCGLHPKVNTSFCRLCRNEYNRNYRKKNPEKRKIQNDRYNRNPELKIKRKVYEKVYREKNLQSLKDYRNDYNRKQREKVIAKYNGKCNCCGEKRIEFLAIDHINGGGAKHRNSISVSIYRWLIINNFPDGFQVLCHNCNSSKSYYGYCPHARENLIMRDIYPKELAGKEGE